MLKKCMVIFLTLLVVCSSFIPAFTPAQNIANAATLPTASMLSTSTDGSTGVSTTSTFMVGDRVCVCTSSHLWVHHPDVGNRYWLAPDYCTGII